MLYCHGCFSLVSSGCVVEGVLSWMCYCRYVVFVVVTGSSYGVVQYCSPCVLLRMCCHGCVAVGVSSLVCRHGCIVAGV